MVKNIILIITSLLLILSIIGSAVVHASEVITSNNSEQINMSNNIDLGLQNSVDDSVQVERDRGVGSHGERPKIYPARLNKAQKDCLVNIAGASILSSFSKPWFILPGSVALAWYNSCSRL